MECRHCNANLDKGDIFEHFLSFYKDHERALEAATKYGWTLVNKKRFSRTISVHPDEFPSFLICPDCNKRDPLPDIDHDLK